MLRKMMITGTAAMALAAAAAMPAQAIQCEKGYGGTLNCVDLGS